MALAEGADYAWARPRPAVLVSRGCRFVVRYLSYSSTGKNLTPAERDALLDAGLLLVLVWETTADAALGGHAAGVKHATAAAAQAHALGAPADVVIYFAVDFNPTLAQLSTVNAYFDGVCSVIPFARVGVYGGLRTVQAAKAQGWAKFLWQTYAWSDGVWEPGVHAQQYHNGVSIDGQDCDLDRAMADYIGQWGRQGAVHDWEGDDMTPEEWITQPMGSAGLGITNRPLGDWLKDGYKARQDITALTAKVDALAAYIMGQQQAPAAIGPADLAAIEARVHDALRSDLAKMLGALDAGKDATPPGVVTAGG